MRPNAEPSKIRCNKTGNFSNNGTKESKKEKFAGRIKEIRKGIKGRRDFSLPL
jgi:hypothetical protein